MSVSSGLAVPKFGSFKARTPARQNDDSSVKPKSGSGHTRRRNDLEKDSPSATAPPRGSVGSNKQQLGAESVTSIVESDLFVIDVRGDPKNLEYGCLHRYSIPSYRRAGSGSVVGAPPNVKIDRDNSSEKSITLHHDRMALPAQSVTSPDHVQDRESRQPLSNSMPIISSKEPEEDFLHLKRKRDLDFEPRGTGIWSFIQADTSSDDDEASTQTRLKRTQLVD